MDTLATLSFAVKPLGDEPGDADVLTLTPIIDGTLLTELVERFEQEQGFDISSGYGGLVPGWFKYGPLDRYFLGEAAEDHWNNLGGFYLLGCQCGEVGCWPLVARISNAGNNIVWSEFRQPHRPNRDYSRFGPFVFDSAQYRLTVAEIASKFEKL